jgi:Protein of unknown function (DUF1569)
MKTLRNSRDREEVIRRLAQVSSEDPAQWGRMSAHQMLCHLRDSYSLLLREKTVSPATGLLQRTVIKWAALWVPVHWMKGYPTRPEMEQGRGGTAPVEFQRDQNMLQDALRRFCEAAREPTLPHPVFGPMNPHEWWRWGYLHADHHLRQFGR